MRVCSTIGCPVLLPAAGRCPEHERAHDKARGSKAARGYGPNFQRERRVWIARIARGGVACVRCDAPITSTDPFHLDHDDVDRTIIRGPACPHCNLSAAGKNSHR
jgi:hypothetical protein